MPLRNDAASLARASSTSLTATTFAPGTAVMSRRICSWPIIPTPMTPTFTVMGPSHAPRRSISDRQRSPLPQIRRPGELAVRRAHDRVGRTHRLAQDDRMAHLLEEGDSVRRYAALDVDLIGEELVVGARSILRLGDVEPIVDHVDDHLQHDGDDARSAGA